MAVLLTKRKSVLYMKKNHAKLLTNVKKYVILTLPLSRVLFLRAETDKR